MSVNSENASVSFPRLSIFQSISSLPLISVGEKSSEGRLEEMVLDFGETSLIITANEEEDSLEVRAAQRPDTADFVDVSGAEPWNKFVGKKFGRGWLTVNQLGAWDGLVLGSEALDFASNHAPRSRLLDKSGRDWLNGVTECTIHVQPSPSMREPVDVKARFSFFLSFFLLPRVSSHLAKPPLSPSFHPHSFVSDLRSVLGGCSRSVGAAT